MKKYLVLSITTLCALATLTGCGRRDGEAVDDTKAQLRIETFDGGVKAEWLKVAARAFEEKNAERTDFKEGKTGVQIHVDANRTCGGGSLKSTTNLKSDIYFTESVEYYTLTNQGKLADITDVLTAENPEDGNKTILSKIDENLKNYMNRDGKYYAVPFYDCFYGLVYDKDLFKEKGLYMKDDGSFTKSKDRFGTGPNGIAGDWDDGLPKTYAQFRAMMQEMVDQNVVPFTYSFGNSTEYTRRALCSYWSDDEGYDDVNLNFTFNGTAHNIVTSIVNYVPQTETVAITKDNGYLLRGQAGLYNALHFARDILLEPLEGGKKTYQGYDTNYDVQNNFINSYSAGGSVKPIAMMFEGTWWENEAEQYFDYAKQNSSRKEYNYGFMPIPKSTEDKVGQDATIMNLNDSYGFINANSANMKLAKEFFAFLHTDAQMRQFTLQTNMTRGLDYSFDVADLDKISSYARDLVAMKESEHVKIIYPYSGLDFVINHSDEFKTEIWAWKTTNYTDNPFTWFVSKSTTAEEYFNDHKSMVNASKWSDSYLK